MTIRDSPDLISAPPSSTFMRSALNLTVRRIPVISFRKAIDRIVERLSDVRVQQVQPICRRPLLDAPTIDNKA